MAHQLQYQETALQPRLLTTGSLGQAARDRPAISLLVTGIPNGAASVTPANISESQGARLLGRCMGRRRGVTKKLRRVWVDAGYKAGAIAWYEQKRGVTLEVVTRDKQHCGFILQKRRWVIERTFSWLCAHRRLARDYEGCIAHSEALVWMALSRILLKRLA